MVESFVEIINNFDVLFIIVLQGVASCMISGLCNFSLIFSHNDYFSVSNFYYIYIHLIHDTQSAQILQNQNGRNVSVACPVN